MWDEQAFRRMRERCPEGVGMVPEAAGDHHDVEEEEDHVEDEEEAADGVEAAEPVAVGDVVDDVCHAAGGHLWGESRTLVSLRSAEGFTGEGAKAMAGSSDWMGRGR